MFVICDKCEDVYPIFECKKTWINEKQRYPTYECETCRNLMKDAISMQKNEEVCVI